jgi:hypothetical protein
MEAPIRIQAPHHPHLFRGHSYPNEIYTSRSRDSRDSNMSHPSSPRYESARDSTLSRSGNDYRAALPATNGFGRDVRGHDVSPLHHRPLPSFLPSQPSSMHPTSSQPRSYEYSTEQPRIPVSQLVEEDAIPRHTHQASQNLAHHRNTTSSPMAAHRNHDQESQRVELPGVDQVSVLALLYVFVSLSYWLPIVLTDHV